MTKKTNKSKFEDKMNRLEEISSLLEKDDLELEEAIALYEEGIRLSQECLGALKHAEIKITELKEKINKVSDDGEVHIEE
jgi:exodeoxyribonuclease VII small subunit